MVFSRCPQCIHSPDTCTFGRVPQPDICIAFCVKLLWCLQLLLEAGVAGPVEPRGFRRLWRVLRQLFHEVVGATFAVLALGWFNSALRAWTRGRRPLAHRSPRCGWPDLRRFFADFVPPRPPTVITLSDFISSPFCFPCLCQEYSLNSFRDKKINASIAASPISRNCIYIYRSWEIIVIDHHGNPCAQRGNEQAHAHSLHPYPFPFRQQKKGCSRLTRRLRSALAPSP